MLMLTTIYSHLIQYPKLLCHVHILYLYRNIRKPSVRDTSTNKIVIQKGLLAWKPLRYTHKCLILKEEEDWIEMIDSRTIWFLYNLMGFGWIARICELSNWSKNEISEHFLINVEFHNAPTKK